MATDQIAPTYGLLCFAKGAAVSSGQAKETISLPEIHLNIWEREPEKKFSRPSDSSLDIGLMIHVLDSTKSIELIFPEKVGVKDVKDLSEVVSLAAAVPVIFNESWAVISNGAQGTGCVVYDAAKPEEAFAIVSVTGAIDETKHLDYDALTINVHSLIAKGRNTAESLHRNINRVYVRFRVTRIPRNFYCVGASEHKQRWWMPSWQRTEDIDFRLNVRRGSPIGLENHIGRFVEFSKVHLFLMRSRDKDIVFQDKLFNSSRSLEDEAFWAKYSLLPGQQTEKALNASRKRVKNSLGYHWKAKASPEPIKEFATLARFKIIEFGIGKFLLVALVMGATGNAIWDGVKKVWDYGVASSHVAHFGTGVDIDLQKEKIKLAPESAGTVLPLSNQVSSSKEEK
jgi:hypothetical protein